MDRNTNWTRYLWGNNSILNRAITLLVWTWKFYGFSPSKKKSYPFDYDIDDYVSTDAAIIKAHKAFLETIREEEQNRLTLIESKSSMLVSQTGIIFSLLSLFIPIIIGQISGMHFILRIAFFIILISAFLFYIITIKNAMRNSNIKAFSYSKPHPNNVIKYQTKTEAEFDAIVVKDLLHGANENKRLNNIKADNLIYSYRSFKMANTLTGALVVSLCLSLLFVYEEDKTITIENPVIINNFDSLINKSSIRNLTEVTKQKTTSKTIANKIDTTKTSLPSSKEKPQ